MAGGTFGGGNGEVGTPFLVEDAADLDAVRNDLSAHYLQTDDIDASGFSPWNPISPGWNAEAFHGVYDGGGYTISNITIVSTEAYAAVFGIVGRSDEGWEEHTTEIKNVRITSLNGTSSQEGLGGLAGYAMHATFTNCHVSGTLTNTNTSMSETGMIVGYGASEVQLIRCSASGSILTDRRTAGGLIGQAQHVDIERCFASVDITGTGTSATQLGGLVGSASQINGQGNTIVDSYATGNINGAEGAFNGFFGGLGGQVSYTDVSQCYAVGSVSGGNDAVGGLFGQYADGGTIENTFYDLDTSGQEDAFGWSWSVTEVNVGGRTTEELQIGTQEAPEPAVPQGRYLTLVHKANVTQQDVNWPEGVAWDTATEPEALAASEVVTVQFLHLIMPDESEEWQAKVFSRTGGTEE